MKKLILAAAISSLVPLASAQAAEIELNLGHVLAPDSHYHVVAENLAKIVEEKTNGDIKINIFPSGQLGGEIKLIQSARTGALPLVVTGEAPVENTIKEFGVFSLPYLFEDLQTANNALQGEFGQHMLDYLGDYGLVGLGFISSLERNVFGKRKIETPEDMEAMKIRVIQSPGYVNAYEAFGAQPTPMAYSELYLALQTGVIDAAENSPDLMIQDKFAEVSDYYNVTKTHYMPALVIMSQAHLDKLTPEQQAIIKESAKEAIARGIEYYEDGYDKALKDLPNMGVEVVIPDITPFKAKMEKVYPDLLAEIPDGEANFNAAREASKK